MVASTAILVARGTLLFALFTVSGSVCPQRLCWNDAAGASGIHALNHARRLIPRLGLGPKKIRLTLNSRQATAVRRRPRDPTALLESPRRCQVMLNLYCTFKHQQPACTLSCFCKGWLCRNLGGKADR